MASSGLVYLIQGASGGLGNFTAKILLAKEKNTVIAVVRNPDSDHVAALRDAPKGAGSKLIVVKLNGSTRTDAQKAIDGLQQHGIEFIDVVIAGAGVWNSAQTVFENELDAFQEAISVNTVAPLQLFNATRALLLASKERRQQTPKFVILSSAAGSIDQVGVSPLSNVTYAASKAAVNIVGIRLSVEEKNIITLLVHPGLVDTSMTTNAFGQLNISADSLKEAGVTMLQPQEATELMLAEIAKASEKDSGRFIDTSTGKTLPW